MRALIICPVCKSASRIPLPTSKAPACDDCGFDLAFDPTARNFDGTQCLFCGGRRFYLSSPFGVGFLGVSSVCYVCEAAYGSVRVLGADRAYRQAPFGTIETSPEGVAWSARARRWTQAGL